MKLYEFTTHPHIGDNVVCTAAVRNVCAQYPNIKFVLPKTNEDIFLNNPDFVVLGNCDSYTQLPKITYGSLELEKQGANGSIVEAYTKSLCQLLGIAQVPLTVRKPVLFLTYEEKERSKEWNDAILLNANCQTCSRSKGYPHWQKVVDMLNGRRIVQIGGNEARDLSLELNGVEDMRGKTTLRDLIVMAYGCKGVMSPPSCITNIAGAFDKPQIVVNASREPDVISSYENVVHISHRSRCGWGVENGCVACSVGGGNRTCLDFVEMGDRKWCRCQWETNPMDIANAAIGIM